MAQWHALVCTGPLRTAAHIPCQRLPPCARRVPLHAAAGAQAPRRGAAGQGQGQGQDEGHTGITDDEAGPGGDDDEGEPDYDVASRMTLKASSEAFLEVRTGQPCLGVRVSLRGGGGGCKGQQHGRAGRQGMGSRHAPRRMRR